MYPYYSLVTGLTANDIAAVRQLYAARDAGTAPPAPGTPEPAPDPKPVDPAPPEPPKPANPPKPPNPPQPPQKPPIPDTVAPSLRILSPPTTTVLTSGKTIVISGAASDNVGVVKVTWTDSIGNTGPASGTTSWQTAAIPVRVGSNTITIRAFDAAGNSGWRSLVVTRR
jgi:outer membrane biosynthesis protein TonB